MHSALKKTLIFCLLLGQIFYCTYTYSAESSMNYIGDIRNIVQRGKLIVALPQIVESPMLFVRGADGNLSGYYVDFAKEVAKELGVAVEFNQSAKSFNEVIDIIAQGKADVAICHFSKTTDRAKKVLYTNSDVVLYQTLVVNRVWLTQHSGNVAAKSNNSSPFDVVKSHKCRIGVIGGSSYEEFVHDNFPLAVIYKDFQTERQIFDALLSGKVDAIFDDDFHIKEQLIQQPGTILKFRAIVLKSYPDFIAMAVPPGKWELRYWLNLYLETKNIKMNANKLLQYHGIEPARVAAQ